MATKETIWGAVQLMAGAWKFPGVDLKQTAMAYYEALRDLADEDIERATKSLLASWPKETAPKPAVIRQTAHETRPSPPKPPRLERPAPTHEEIMAKLKRDMYATQAIKECGLADKRIDRWTHEQRRAVATKQRDYRQKLGIPEPDASRAPVRPAWDREVAR